MNRLAGTDGSLVSTPFNGVTQIIEASTLPGNQFKSTEIGITLSRTISSLCDIVNEDGPTYANDDDWLHTYDSSTIGNTRASGQDSAVVVSIVHEMNHKSKKNSRLDRRTKGEACKGKGKLSSSEGSS